MSKERPILFSGPMVRALLDGSKTQTRRVVKPQPTEFVGGTGVTLHDGSPAPLVPLDDSVEPYGREIVCRYGQPGDRLWVRETFVQGWDFDPVTDRIKRYDSDGKQIPIKTWYRADGADIGWCDADGWEANTPWKPSIHMPRAASRITLEITSVRVERLQDISDADCVAEGCGALPAAIGRPMTSAPGETIPRAMFRALWESINGPDSWAANPWVWAIEFRRLP